MEGGSKVIAVTTRSVPFSPLPFSSWVLGGIDNRRCAEALQTVSSWAVPSLYLPKTALVALASLYPFPVTVTPSSSTYTYLKRRLQPLQIFHQKIWPCKMQAFPHWKNFSFTET